MADTLQHGSISGSASVRQGISGEITIGGKIMKELRFLPYSEFPEIGREETLYIDTDNNAMYYYDGSAYVALSGGGGGTDNYNALTNKPSVNSVILIGNKTSSELGLQELISDLSTIRSGAALGTTAVQPEALETALSEKQDAINDLDDIRAGAELGETAVQPSDMESALADKQDVISDLSTIRSGAALGATAVQPSDMESALADKQDTISDLSDIRSGASAGTTAVQPSDMETALSGKQDTISDLQTIRSGAALGATAVQPADMETALADKQDVIDDLNDIRTGAGLGATAVQPSDMESALADKQDVISDLDAIRSGSTAGNTALQPEDVDTLPTDGSSNPVSSGGTYNFVNSSIATNTAYFIGTFASVAELEAYTGTVTNNDYAFVTSTDSAGNTLYNRYKYNAATQEWSFEYAVNNTAFTAAQWAAIQSGMTSADKTKLDGIEQGANKTVIDATPTSGSSNAVSSGGVHTALSGKQDTISDLSDIRSGASAGATAVQPSALNDYQTKLSGTNKLDPAYIEYDATHRAVTDTEKSTWNGKQDAISDLSTIRSGAAAGATALQQSDVSSTYSATGTAPVNGTAVSGALGTLDVSSVGGSGKYISAISETNGKISATPTTFDTVLSSSSTNNNAPTSKTVFDGQQRQEVEIGDVANRGAKNLLDYTFSINGNTSANTANGVTFTINADRSISTSGTASGNVTTAWIQRNYVVPSDPVILSGCPAGGADNKYRIDILDGSPTSTVVAADYGNGVVIKSSMFTNGIGLIRIRIEKGRNVDGLVFKPMIRPASITDSTFVPYAKTNAELTVENASQQSEIDYAVNTGAKNLFKNTAVSKTYLGVTFTVNEDGTVSLSGAATTAVGVLEIGTVTPPAGSYIVSGCPAGGSWAPNPNKYRIRIAKNGVWLGDETGTGYTVTVNGSDVISLQINSAVGFDTAGLVFKPMIRPASITDSTFQPYALSNPVLTPALIEQVDGGAKNHISADANFTSYQHRGLTYTNNHDETINVNGTTNAADSYITIYNLSTQELFGFSAGDTVTVSSTSDIVALQIVPKKSDGSYGSKIIGTKSSPVIYTIPNDVVGYFVRIGVDKNNVTVNSEDVGIMVCAAADYTISPKFVPYLKPYSEIGRLGYHIETVVLNSVTITKSGNGIFYTRAIDASDKFDLLLGATLNNFGNLQSNIAIMPAIKPTDKTYSLWICDSTNPKTLPVLADSQVKVVLYGILKGQ